ncbi:unnamed protein product [Vicia faba]|uniref:Glycoside hydrolase family 5 domain-containing protein n=1 Tax=Vicia faba TaxID=3906 RepID=A0AAV0YE08_VICFA|nr:unnamed protein product [Vicia faba]
MIENGYLNLLEQTLTYKAVNLGSWLLAERWLLPPLFDGIVNSDLLPMAVQLLVGKHSAFGGSTTHPSILECSTRNLYGNKPSLGGIGLMNEPQGVNIDNLKKYYKVAYDTVRKYSPNAYVIMSNPLDENSKVHLSFVSGFNKVVLDVHYYNLYSDTFNHMNVQ